MQIGELAKMAACKVVTIRYYEKKGLLQKPDRTAANYRNYTREDAERLCFIRHCRRHGMSLEEVAELLALSENSGGDCRRVHAIIREHLDNINKQIGELEQLKNSLQDMLQKCAGRDGECLVLKNLHDMNACSWRQSCLHAEKA